MPLSPEVLAAVTSKFRLESLPQDQLVALWNACSQEFIRREKAAVKLFVIGDPVRFRFPEGGVLHGVVIARHVRTITVGVKTSTQAAKYHVSPFNAVGIEDGPAAETVRRFFQVTRCRPIGDSACTD